jgi:hypothetical protein
MADSPDTAAPYRPIPDDEEFLDILRNGSFYAERMAFARLAATIGVGEAYSKWNKLQGAATHEEFQEEIDRLIGESVKTAAELAAAHARVAELEAAHARCADLYVGGHGPAGVIEVTAFSSSGCDGCGCCTHEGCHRFADATCPTDSLGDSVCPCTEG